MTQSRFRWAACQLDTLVDCLDLSMLEDTLVCLPSTLYGTYDRILNKIPHGWQQGAIRILQFLAYSDEPLRLEEAVDILAVDLGKSPSFKPEYRIPQPQDICRLCSSLVTNVKQKRLKWRHKRREWEIVCELQLAHFSVKEYLLSRNVQANFAPYFEEIEARATIMFICIAYLSQIDIDASKKPSSDTWEKFPFARYSATQWPAHARLVEHDDEAARSIIVKTFLGGGTVYNWLRLIGPDGDETPQESQNHNLSDSLCYAAEVGLRSAMEALLQKGVSVDARGGN